MLRISLAITIIALQMLSCGFASAQRASQVPDVIVLDVYKEWLLNRPLTPYLNSHRGLLPRPDQELPENTRGYVASWKIVDKKLFIFKAAVLLKETRSGKKNEFATAINVMDRLFPSAGDVFAEWYSGILVIQRSARNPDSSLKIKRKLPRQADSSKLEFLS